MLGLVRGAEVLLEAVLGLVRMAEVSLLLRAAQEGVRVGEDSHHWREEDGWRLV